MQDQSLARDNVLRARSTEVELGTEHKATGVAERKCREWSPEKVLPIWNRNVGS